MSLIAHRRQLLANSDGIYVERPLVLFDGDNNIGFENWQCYSAIFKTGTAFYTDSYTQGWLVYTLPITLRRKDRLKITLKRRDGAGSFYIAPVFSNNGGAAAADPINAIAWWSEDQTRGGASWTVKGSVGETAEVIFTPFRDNYEFSGVVGDALTIYIQTNKKNEPSVYIKKIELL